MCRYGPFIMNRTVVVVVCSLFEKETGRVGVERGIH